MPMAIDMLEHSQDEMWKKSLYWTSSTFFYWNNVSLLFDLLKDRSKIILTLSHLLKDLSKIILTLSHLLKDLSSTIWLKAATLSIPGTPPVFSGGGKVENTPENIFSFLWRIDVVILNTMFVKSWLHLYSKVLRWNQHTNSWEKV